jgi:hypothetical protein
MSPAEEGPRLRVFNLHPVSARWISWHDLGALIAIGTFLGADAQTPFYSAFSLNTAEELRQLASNAGMQNIRVRFEHRTMRYPVSARFVAGWISGAPIAAPFLVLPDDRKQAFIADIVERVATYVDDGGLAVPMENHL